MGKQPRTQASSTAPEKSDGRQACFQKGLHAYLTLFRTNYLELCVREGVFSPHVEIPGLCGLPASAWCKQEKLGCDEDYARYASGSRAASLCKGFALLCWPATCIQLSPAAATLKCLSQKKAIVEKMGNA